MSNERNLVNRQWHTHLCWIAAWPGKLFLLYSSHAVYTDTLSSISTALWVLKPVRALHRWVCDWCPSHTVPQIHQIHRDARSSSLISILILKETNLLVRPISTDTSCDLSVRLDSWSLALWTLSEGKPAAAGEDRPEDWFSYISTSAPPAGDIHLLFLQVLCSVQSVLG